MPFNGSLSLNRGSSNAWKKPSLSINYTSIEGFWNFWSLSFLFLLRLDQFYRAEDMKCVSQEEEEKNFRQNFRNLTWCYLYELTWAKWLIWYDLLIWPDQLIWYGWFADQLIRLIRLISSWSDQLIKKFQIFFSNFIFEKKNIFWMILSTDLISWLADQQIRLISSWSDQLIKKISKKILKFFLKRKIFFEWSDQLSDQLIGWSSDQADQQLIWSVDKKIFKFFFYFF